MSAELYRQIVDAWNAGDVEGIVRLCHPDVELRSLLVGVEGGAYHGHDGIRSYFADLGETFTDARLTPGEVEERGDWVVSSVRVGGTGRASGAPVALKFAHVLRFDDGLCAFVGAARDREAALAVAGLE